MSRLIPWIVLLIVAAVWGGSFAAIRYLVSVVTPEELLIARFTWLSMLVFVWILISYRKTFFVSFARLWWLYITLSVIWLYGYHYVLNIGETVIPAAPAGLIICTAPIWTILIAAALRMERLTWGKGIGAIVAFAGTGVMTYYGSGDEAVQLNISPEDWIKYSMFTFIAPIAVSVHVLLAKPFIRGENRFKEKVDPVILNIGYMLPTGFLSLILFRPEMTPHIFNGISMYWITLFYLVLLCTIFANTAWFWALKSVDAGQAGIMSYTIPLFALLYSWILLREPIGTATLIGAAGIIIGVLIAGAEEILSHGRNNRKGGDPGKYFG